MHSRPSTSARSRVYSAPRLSACHFPARHFLYWPLLCIGTRAKITLPKICALLKPPRIRCGGELARRHMGHLNSTFVTPVTVSARCFCSTRLPAKSQKWGSTCVSCGAHGLLLTFQGDRSLLYTSGSISLGFPSTILGISVRAQRPSCTCARTEVGKNTFATQRKGTTHHVRA